MLNTWMEKLFKKDDHISLFLNEPDKLNPSQESWRIALIYGVFGGFWILFSDQILFILISDPQTYRNFQTAKGWIYVFVTTILIYLLLRTRITVIQKALEEIFSGYEQMQSANEELVAMDDELRYQIELTESIIDNAPVIIGTWDWQGKIKKINKPGEKILGYKEEEVIDKCFFDFLVPEENKNNMQEVFHKIKRDKELKNYESQLVTKTGERIDVLWNSSILSNNNLGEMVSVGTDITERKLILKKLQHLAYYDALTGLPNRIALENEMNNLIAEKEKDHSFVLIYMDFDNFKYINDTLGHHVGDELLRFIANKLEDTIKPPNMIARLGGDEFAIIFKNVSDKEEVIEKVESFIKSFEKIWRNKNHEFYISFSLGIVIYPDQGQDVVTLLKNADIAMYNAKKEGKGKYCFYTEKMQEKSYQNIQMANQLQNAITDNELALYYQPLVDLKTGELQGVEVLIRWFQPEKGFISPKEFIPLAEGTGQIYEIERWVVETALHQKKKWEQDFPTLEMSINLSSKTLTSDSNFIELEGLLSSVGADLSRITLEITETAVISEVEFTIEKLKRLQRMGIKIALDDFGTGYSSLTHLKDLPIHTIKLDGDFIRSIEKNERDAVIIKSIIHLAHELNYKIVAEGIEKQEQLDFLINYGCDTGQGYLFSRPIPVEELNEILKLENYFFKL